MDLQMKIAIVGSSKATFLQAEEEIRKIIAVNKPCVIISGNADGIDSIADRIAGEMNVKTIIYPPKTKNLEGYRERNMLIAKNCDKLYNIVLEKNPKDMGSCYHHKVHTHYRSGGCWTENMAKQLGKQVMVIEI